MNESLPLVTFIITTYNLPDEYLRTCIKHVLHLTLTPKEREVIVVDDGSALSCVEELDEYMDDKSFVVCSNSYALGACVHVSKKVDLNVAYFTTIYGHKKMTEVDHNTGLDYNSDFTRTNNVLGVGVDFHF